MKKLLLIILLFLTKISFAQSIDKVVDDKIKKALDTIKVKQDCGSIDTVLFIQRNTISTSVQYVDTMTVNDIAIFYYDVTTKNKVTGDGGDALLRVVVQKINGVYSLSYKSISAYSGKGTVSTCKILPTISNNNAVLSITGTANNISWTITRKRSVIN